MGGDDLGDDFDYLGGPVEATPEERLLEKVENEDKKRKRQDEDDEDDETTSKKSSHKVLIEAGRDLENQSAEVQAAFLWMSMKHYVQMKGESIAELMKIEPRHLLASTEETMAARVKSVVSMKKLKKWKPIGSPMIVIVCLSARRAVDVLKELSSLKVRAAKLFAKHLSMGQQKEMLQETSWPIAVGTPNRLQLLCQAEDGGKAPLYLGKTTLVLLDSQTNQKGFTVCTLPDTAPDTMDFIKQRVMPQMKLRKDIKLACL